MKWEAIEERIGLSPLRAHVHTYILTNEHAFVNYTKVLIMNNILFEIYSPLLEKH